MENNRKSIKINDLEYALDLAFYDLENEVIEYKKYQIIDYIIDIEKQYKEVTGRFYKFDEWPKHLNSYDYYV